MDVLGIIGTCRVHKLAWGHGWPAGCSTIMRMMPIHRVLKVRRRGPERLPIFYLAGLPQEKLAAATNKLGGNFDGKIEDLGL
jgi:hypothetical protein